MFRCVRDPARQIACSAPPTAQRSSPAPQFSHLDRQKDRWIGRQIACSSLLTEQRSSPTPQSSHLDKQIDRNSVSDPLHFNAEPDPEGIKLLVRNTGQKDIDRQRFIYRQIDIYSRQIDRQIEHQLPSMLLYSVLRLVYSSSMLPRAVSVSFNLFSASSLSSTGRNNQLFHSFCVKEIIKS